MGIGSCEEEMGAVERELEAGNWFIFRLVGQEKLGWFVIEHSECHSMHA